jgi:hypothetical protein
VNRRKLSACLAASGACAAAAVVVAVSTTSASGSTGPTYPTNAHGQSYGSAAVAESRSQLPDLVRVQADNGAVGYIQRGDFEGPALTRDQVLQLPRDADGNFVEPKRTLTVYASDGTTVVGTFTLVPAAPTAASTP